MGGSDTLAGWFIDGPDLSGAEGSSLKPGATLTFDRDLTGPILPGHRFRVDVEGYAIMPPDYQPSDALWAIKRKAMEFFAEGTTELNRSPTQGSPFTLDNGDIRVYMDVQINGTAAESIDAASMRAAIYGDVGFDRDSGDDFDFRLNEGGVWLTDLDDPNPQTQTYKPLTSKQMIDAASRGIDLSIAGNLGEGFTAVGKTAGDAIGSAAKIVGTAAGATVKGVAGGLFSGLGTSGTIILLIVVAIVLAVLYFMLRGAV
jgi:hypothetical protein